MNLNSIERLYSENITKYGIDSRSVGWNTEDSQKLRFKMLLNLIEEKNMDFSINELGCGYGELYNYLKQNNFAVKEFKGYDISKPMLDHCKVYLKNAIDLKLFNSSKISELSDYTVTSGIFNVPGDNKLKEWEDYIEETLINMFEYSEKGISFNLLTTYVDYEDENLYYGDPKKYFSFCKTKLSKNVSLFHDYNLFEWTIIVKK